MNFLSFLKKRKNPFKPIQSCDISFDPNEWIHTHKHIKVNTNDMMRLEGRIEFVINNGLLEKDTLLYYLVYRNYMWMIKKKRAEVLRNETPKEKVIRLLKQDFEENNGISFKDFMRVYTEIIEKEPELLI